MKGHRLGNNAISVHTCVFLMAMYIGPGPGRYALPTGVGYVKHDFSKRMNPAYSFGRKLSDLSE